jgi:hypothetical protein
MTARQEDQELPSPTRCSKSATRIDPRRAQRLITRRLCTCDTLCQSKLNRNRHYCVLTELFFAILAYYIWYTFPRRGAARWALDRHERTLHAQSRPIALT